MTVAKFVQPNYLSSTASAYKAAIDAAIAVLATVGADYACHAKDTPDMQVLVDAGQLFLANSTLVSNAQQTSATIVAPVGNPRIDRIVINDQTGVVSVITGVAAASPVAPAITAGTRPIAQILLQTSSTVIANSMITDERVTTTFDVSAFMRTLLGAANDTAARATLVAAALAGSTTQSFSALTAGIRTDTTQVATTEYVQDHASLNWIRAESLGSGLAIATVGTPALAALNGTDVAFIDSFNDSLRTYRFNGLTWTQLGTGLSIAGVGVPALAALNDIDVAFYDGTNNLLTTYRFNVTTSVWAAVGTSLTITGTTSSPALAALNGTDVAFIDNVNDSLRTYRFNGSTWSQVGSSLAISTVGFPALAALNGTDVALVDSSSGSLRTYRFDGSTWSLLGSAYSLGAVGLAALTGLNGTDVAFLDSIGLSLRAYRFNGSTWSLVGHWLAFGAFSATPALATFNGTDVAFIDGGGDTLYAYRFAFSIGNGPYHP